MRLHTDTLTTVNIMEAMRTAHVDFHNFGHHGSRSRDHAFEITLEGSSSYRVNSGRNGGRYRPHAATWDEWGIFLNHLFDKDPEMHCWAYADAGDFHYKTDHRFETLRWEDQHRNHNWEFAAPGASKCVCGAVRRWM